jgi:hypothetical protein
MDPIAIEPTRMTADSVVVPELSPPEPSPRKLTDIPVKDENTALNLMIGFLDTAQKRGAFSIDESAKIWECIQKFIPPQQPPANP